MFHLLLSFSPGPKSLVLLNCSDGDFSSANNQLTYSLSSSPDDGKFMMNDTAITTLGMKNQQPSVLIQQ